MNTKVVITLAVLVATMAMGSEAIKCYTCTSATNADCKTPIGKVTPTECGSLSKYCMKVSVGDLVTRSCSLACTNAKVGNSETACCDKDQCNSGTRSYMDVSLLLLGVVAMFAARRQL